MAYLNYNRSLYRTGFRTYGQTNPWAASQLNGISIDSAALSGYLGQSHPFTDAGGWRLHGMGQARAFSPWVLKGMAVCLDQNENTIACTDPDCTYGDCGSTGEQQVGGALCLDQKQNQISCASPECSYGDCIAPVRGLLPGPSPRVGVSVTQVPPTAPQISVPRPAWMASSIIKGVPDILLYGFAAIAAISFIAPSGGRRR